VVTPFENFKNWYPNVIRSLYPNRNAGFVILLATFPLLERYIRQRLGWSEQNSLNDTFYNELARVLPDLRNRDNARNLWSAYRNGLLHVVTLSSNTRKGIKLPVAWLTHDSPFSISIDASGSFCVNPVLFAEQVLKIIEDDFETFETGPRAILTFPQVLELRAIDETWTATMTGTASISTHPLNTTIPGMKLTK
jgi:hypothetical protein